mmetsp:Transcript_17756/g.39918  ORF Transcript_17756/g.39918 Transcript_17756/m.39918 type:complete len:307 (-) Transcript_17756:102-1022(-)
MPCLPLLRSSKDSKGDADTEHAFEASPGQQLQSKGTRMPCVYVNHGGGPMPLLGQQPDLAAYLSGYAAQLPAKPTAIVIVTAHWEEQIPTVSTGTNPQLYFDYGGFPPETYKYKYPASGSPALAQQVQGLLEGANIKSATNPSRGWDHGVFVPLMLMFPDASVPVVMVSCLKSQDAAAHVAMGEALRPLRDQGVLLIGSGSSFHNFKYFFARDPATRSKGEQHSRDFDGFLREQCDVSAPYPVRKASLEAWHKHPSAYEAHPRGAAEHLMPFFVCFGAAAESCSKVRADPNTTPSAGYVASSIEFV